MGKDLITGGPGFLGINLAKRLVKDGREVILFDIISNSKFIKHVGD